ncbi:putative efflux protein, MATE family [Anaerovirgula multivorans]|uniref:Multidrug export protein MepA n=1 Tax=Anaerovirgula multivorans TaxID=312168 RepID=A0A239K0E6_9FIRM|nr:MATE family efflux transporter [Anaerovirgula multivorans]SNT11143.1 putative efflux protein, MATE family [Anaerovirgula multivorans]
MKTENEQLGTMSVGKLLFKFSLPAIGGMLVNSLYNLVDRIFIGRLGALAMTGIGLSLPFMALISAVSSLIGIGASAIISMRLGQNRNEDAKRVIGNAVSLLTVLMIIVSFVGLIFKIPILNIFGASKATIDYASEYITIILYGTVFQGIGMGLINIIRAEGSPFKAMVIIVLGTVINIILDPIFIFTFNMGIAGAAWATIISQLVTSVLVINHFISKKSKLKIQKKDLNFNFTAIKDILSIGFSPFIMQLAAVLVSIILNNSLREYGGDVAIGAMTVINSVMVLFLMSAMGITQGAQPIIGYNYGAGKFGRVKKTLQLELISISAICILTFIMVQFFPDSLARIFSNDQDLIGVSSNGMRIFLMMLPLVGAQIVGASYFQAIGEAKKATILGLLRQVLLLIPMLLILPNFFGLTGVWAAGPVSDFVSCTIAILVLAREMKQLGRKKLILATN